MALGWLCLLALGAMQARAVRPTKSRSHRTEGPCSQYGYGLHEKLLTKQAIVQAIVVVAVLVRTMQQVGGAIAMIIVAIAIQWHNHDTSHNRIAAAMIIMIILVRWQSRDH